MPTEEEDNDHDLVATTTLAGTTTTLPPEPVSTMTEVPDVPASDHPDRPVKPTGSPTAGDSPAGTESPASETSSTSWLPSFLSNVSSKTQIWIYGAIGLIVVFCIGLGIYLYMARRRRLRNNPREDYEFELLDEEEVQGLNSGEKGFAGKKGRKTRGGELYDAFAGGSDEEEGDGFDAAGYRDRSADGEEREDHNEKRVRLDDHDEEHHVVGDDSEEEADEEAEAAHGANQDTRLLGRR